MKKTLLSLFTSLSLAILACSSVPSLPTNIELPLIGSTPVPTALPTLSNNERQQKIFDEIYTAIKDQYVFADYGGVKIDELKKEHDAKIKSGMSNADFEKAMLEFSGKLPNGGAVYQSRSERLKAEADASVKYSGIGAYIATRKDPQPHVVVLSIIQGSPAEKAGLLPHDSIWSVDEKPVTAEEGMDVIKRVRGSAGSTVSLEVQTPGKPKRTIKIARDQITANDTLRGGLFESVGIAYFLLPVATPDDTVDIIAQNLDTLSQKSQLSGIVLDLRVAHGANWPLAEMLTLFGNGDLGQFYSRAKSDPIQIKGIDVGGSQTLPLVILVGPDTEGAAEIFASTLQASKRAIVFGQTTSGKVFGYTALPLSDGSLLTLATSSYKNSKGDDLAKSGVKPDLEVKSADWDQVTKESDPVLERAVQAILLFK